MDPSSPLDRLFPSTECNLTNLFKPDLRIYRRGGREDIKSAMLYMDTYTIIYIHVKLYIFIYIARTEKSFYPEILIQLPPTDRGMILAPHGQSGNL